jgi:hypothetical protein
VAIKSEQTASAAHPLTGRFVNRVTEFAQDLASLNELEALLAESAESATGNPQDFASLSKLEAQP